ncbi:MAG: hypothetical protein WCJ30_25830 [Deltaproteobacteria bacterium]
MNQLDPRSRAVFDGARASIRHALTEALAAGIDPATICVTVTDSPPMEAPSSHGDGTAADWKCDTTRAERLDVATVTTLARSRDMVSRGPMRVRLAALNDTPSPGEVFVLVLRQGLRRTVLEAVLGTAHHRRHGRPVLAVVHHAARQRGSTGGRGRRVARGPR